MKTTARWIMLGTLIGVAVAPPTFLAMRQATEFPGTGARLFDCCEKAENGDATCCAKCCWLPRGCDDCGRPALCATDAS